MSNRKSAGTVINQPSLAAGASVVSSEFDVYTVDKVLVAAVAVSGGASDYIRVTPIGLLDQEWVPLPEPVASAGGSVFGVSAPPYTDNIPLNIAEVSSNAVNYFSDNTGVTGASQPISVTFVIPTYGFSKVRMILTNASSNTIANVKVICGAGGM